MAKKVPPGQMNFLGSADNENALLSHVFGITPEEAESKPAKGRTSHGKKSTKASFKEESLIDPDHIPSGRRFSPQNIAELRHMRRQKVVAVSDTERRQTIVEEKIISREIADSKKDVYSVGELLDSINTILEPLRVTVQGEISSVSTRSSATFFTITDGSEKAILNCVIWRGVLHNSGLTLQEGLEVKIVGRPNVYKPFGKLSFTADIISPVGEGGLKAQFEVLKKKLEEEGFFDTDRKRELPPFIKTVGLITSAYGDARKDFVTHLGAHGFKIVFKDVRVEGSQSIDSIVKAIRWFNEHTQDVEVLVVTRGGGSLESLQAFNSVELAKAIFSSRIPVISAVGHENDISIADMVADIRASTPTHAGKILGQSWDIIKERILHMEQALDSLFKHTITRFEEKILRLYAESVNRYNRTLSLHSQQLKNYEHILNLADPATRLKQGYSITYDKKGKIIRSLRSLSKGEEMTTQLSDGTISSVIQSYGNKK